MDDTAMEAYSKAKNPTSDPPQAHPMGCLSMAFVSVTAGSAFKNKGVQPLLNAVIDYLPVAARRAGPTMGFSPDDETETRDIPRHPTIPSRLGSRFKIMNDPFAPAGLSPAIYSGQVKIGRSIELHQGPAPRASARIMIDAPIHREEIEGSFLSGDIIALAGQK